MKPYYDDGQITIYNADCRDVLPELDAEASDLVLTDPPYGTTQIAWDDAQEWGELWPVLRRLATMRANHVIFSAQPFTTTLIQSWPLGWRYELIWEKTMGTGFYDANRRPLRGHENIQVFCERPSQSTYNPQKVPCAPRKEHRAAKGTRSDQYGASKTYHEGTFTDRHPLSVLHFSNGHGGVSDHPTAKPVALLRWLVSSYSNPDDLVLDPFMGSGTTLRAAKDLGRKAIGIELEERYCEIAANRLRQAVLPMEGAA